MLLSATSNQPIGFQLGPSSLKDTTVTILSGQKVHAYKGEQGAAKPLINQVVGPSRDLPGLHRGQRKLPRPLTLSPFGLVCHIAQQEVKKKNNHPSKSRYYLYIFMDIYIFTPYCHCITCP